MSAGSYESPAAQYGSDAERYIALDAKIDDLFAKYKSTDRLPDRGLFELRGFIASLGLHPRKSEEHAIFRGALGYEVRLDLIEDLHGRAIYLNERRAIDKIGLKSPPLEAIVQLASLPILSLAIRNLAMYPEKIGAYFPSAIAGFVKGLTALEDAKRELKEAKAARKAELEQDVSAEELRLRQQMKSLRLEFEDEIRASKRRRYEIQLQLAREEDDQARAELNSQLTRAEDVLNYQIQLYRDLW
ncbi:hypothetical protein ACFVUS_12480 [Nocardia sp. NPDC058058]|uniref:hypothetical protein n=1 Tax=Nocardia sp. NPDC058058 TaxID=3346317 RepID=UPI0036DA152B